MLLAASRNIFCFQTKCPNGIKGHTRNGMNGHTRNDMNGHTRNGIPSRTHIHDSHLTFLLLKITQKF